MKGELTLRVLEHIGDTAISMLDLASAFLGAGYGASTSKILSEFDKKGRERSQKNAEYLKMKRQRQRFSTMLCRLRNNGLIEEKINKDKSCVQLTSKGKQYFEMLKKRRSDALPNTRYKYKLKDGKFVIVVFDIPERERRKRAWLRSALGNLNFKMIQQSVWAGKVKIPEIFLNNLRELQLMEHVEIFEISKTGSLQQLI